MPNLGQATHGPAGGSSVASPPLWSVVLRIGCVGNGDAFTQAEEPRTLFARIR